jgi:hypothetical protein
MWAQIAKKAITPNDKAMNDALEAKAKSDAADKKRKEHEAYLERKARRERIAKENKEREDAAYALYKQHMWYLYGNKWFHNFEEGTSRANEIPRPFYDRVQKQIEEDYKDHYEMEAKYEKEQREKKETEAAYKAKMKATLSPNEYQEWKREKWFQEQDELDDWLDRGWCDRMESDWICRQREQNGKIWLEEKMQAGKIVLTKDGKYRYYA